MIVSRLKGSNSSVYEERYFLFASTFFIIAVATWLYELKLKWLSVSLFVVYCVFSFYGFLNYWSGLNISQKPGMAAAAKFLGANVENSASQHVFVGSSFEFFNYKYYNFTYSPLPKGISPLLYTGSRADIKQISHVEGVALLSNSDLLPDYNQNIHRGDTVWILWTNAFGNGEKRPEVPLKWVIVDQKSFADVHPWVGTNIYITEYKVN